MNISSLKLKKLLFIIIALSFVFVWSSPFSSSSALEKVLDEQNKVTSSSDQVLIDGIPEAGLFTNDSTSHNYLLQEITQGQVIYFSIDKYTLNNL